MDIRINKISTKAEFDALAGYWKAESGKDLVPIDGLCSITKDGVIVGMITITPVQMVTFHITPGEHVHTSIHAFEALRGWADIQREAAMLFVNKDSPLHFAAAKMCVKMTEKNDFFNLREKPAEVSDGN